MRISARGIVKLGRETGRMHTLAKTMGMIYNGQGIFPDPMEKQRVLAKCQTRTRRKASQKGRTLAMGSPLMRRLTYIRGTAGCLPIFSGAPLDPDPAQECRERDDQAEGA